MKPELQNDFSFYRRSLGSKAIEPLPKPILADSAQVISMWIAQNLPMMSAIADIDPLPLAALANVCCGMVIRQVCGENRAHVLKVCIQITRTPYFPRHRCEIRCSSEAYPIL